MNAEDKKMLAILVSNYDIHDILDTMSEVIGNQIDKLVDMNYGHASMVKELNRVAHHLDIFAKNEF